MSRALIVIALVVGGMAGLYLGIPYSGWVLFVGLLGAVAVV